jgi:hypothetical protein
MGLGGKSKTIKSEPVRRTEPAKEPAREAPAPPAPTPKRDKVPAGA